MKSIAVFTILTGMITTRSLSFASGHSSIPRQYNFRREYFQSVWWAWNERMRLNPRDLKLQQRWRRRFRIPWSAFQSLLQEVRSLGVFTEEPASSGVIGVPLELKLMGWLRVLGRGSCFDDIAELTNASEEVHRVFFHRMCKLYRQHFYPKFVSMPRSNDKILDLMDQYSRRGAPGCLGSMDVVRIGWLGCPQALSNVHSGKEKYPTLGYNAICDHNRKFLSFSTGFQGSMNDKTIVRFDTSVKEFRDGGLYATVEFTLIDGNGSSTAQVGAWLLVDGGYHQWQCMHGPVRFCSRHDELLFNERMESLRKDIECAFGILKARWRILKLPIPFHYKNNGPYDPAYSSHLVDDVVLTCVGLHNWLIDLDDVAEKQVLAMAEKRMTPFETIDMNTLLKARAEVHKMLRQSNHKERVANLTDFSTIGGNRNVLDTEVEVENAWDGRRKALITNHAQMLARGLVEW